MVSSINDILNNWYDNNYFNGDYEVEILLCSYNGGQINIGVSQSYFLKFVDKLRKLGLTPKKTSTVEYNYNNKIRHIKGSDSFILKEKIDNYDNVYDGWRINVKKESHTTLRPSVNDIPHIRNKERITFIMDDSIQFDLTVVNSNQYEIEIEVKSKDDIDKIKNMLKTYFEYEYKASYIDAFNSFITSKRYNTIYYTIYNKPRLIRFESIFNNEEFVITPKFDGLRKILFSYYDQVVEVDVENNKFIPSNIKNPNKELFILDCEFINDNYYPFDILMFNGINITNKNYEYRLDKLLYLSTTLNITSKPFFNTSNFFNDIKSCLYWNNPSNIPLDGIIAQPLNQPYYNKMTYKWKPSETLSIDFRVNVNEGNIKLMVGYLDNDRKYKEREFDIGDNYTIQLLNNNKLNNKIVEFKLVKNELVPMRIRDDKKSPNDINVAKETWEEMMDPITQDDLLGKTLKIYRKYINIRKRDIILELKHKVKTVLDIGIGRGGDIFKWNDVENVYGIDVDDENLVECAKRINSYKGKTKFKIMNIGGEETEKIFKFLGNKKVQIGSSFFSLTFFENKKLDNLIKTIDTCVDEYFIGLTMDGSIVNKSFDQSNIIEIPNLYTIKKISSNTVNIHINDTIVSNQDEFLVNFDKFVLLMNKIGFQLISTLFMTTQNLPSSLIEFSTYQRSFIFKKMKPIVNITTPLLYGDKQNITEEYYRMGTIVGNNSFFASFYTLLDKELGETREKIKKYVCISRHNINLNKKTFKKLMNGNVEYKISYDIFANDVKDCNKWIGMEISEYLADIFSVQIKIYTVPFTLIYQTTKKYDLIINIFYISNFTYEPLIKI